jgi:AraC-like DNA-binding protein
MSDRLKIVESALSPSMGHQGILAAAASGLGDFIRSKGGDPERILSASGIDPEALSRPTASLGLVNYCKVMEEAARSADFGNFGLHYGKQFRPQNLGLIGYIGLNSPTLEAALRNFVNDFAWHQHDTFIALIDQGENWRFSYQVRHGAIVARRQDAELTMGMVLNLIRYVMGPDWAPLELHFEHPRPEQWHEHCKVFDAPVWFDQPCNSMLIPKVGFTRPVPNSDPTLLIVMREAIRRLNQPATPQDMVRRVRAQINLLLPHGEVDLQDVAERLGYSNASLQRRLRGHQVNFSDLVDEVRRDMALHFLDQGHLQVSNISPLLGYSEVSAFSRAFRRWFGVSPRQWRHMSNH